MGVLLGVSGWNGRGCDHEKSFSHFGEGNSRDYGLSSVDDDWADKMQRL
jgi:hypothetical protein